MVKKKRVNKLERFFEWLFIIGGLLMIVSIFTFIIITTFPIYTKVFLFGIIIFMIGFVGALSVHDFSNDC